MGTLHTLGFTPSTQCLGSRQIRFRVLSSLNRNHLWFLYLHLNAIITLRPSLLWADILDIFSSVLSKSNPVFFKMHKHMEMGQSKG